MLTTHLNDGRHLNELVKNGNRRGSMLAPLNDLQPQLGCLTAKPGNLIKPLGLQRFSSYFLSNGNGVFNLPFDKIKEAVLLQ
jgi:hypothetical protein